MKKKIIPLADLTPHPRNYNEHPDDQVSEIAASLQQHGQYRNVVVSRDNYILAGHGVCLGAQLICWEGIDAVIMDFDHNDPRALKVLAADNTLAQFSLADDRELTELLKDIRDLDDLSLEGTGFDDMMLANLAMISRPAHEIADVDHAAEWLGMPGYEPKAEDIRYNILFKNAADRDRFAKAAGLRVGDGEKRTWSTWWPEKDKDDVKSVMVEA